MSASHRMCVRSAARELLVAGGLVLMALVFALEAHGGEPRSGTASTAEMMIRAQEAPAVPRDFSGLSAESE